MSSPETALSGETSERPSFATLGFRVLGFRGWGLRFRVQGWKDCGRDFEAQE